ncbi:hypothetical protein ACGFY7_03375 [Streptomyces prunicolor]|uniref:MmyB family transcriptional regulator n=1 Tax=Streptomyces prunicolor TaxID=67348 RepID=UPI00371D885D
MARTAGHGLPPGNSCCYRYCQSPSGARKRTYRCRHGSPHRVPRLPHVPPRQDHPRTGRPARRPRNPPGDRSAPRGGRDPGRRQRRLLALALAQAAGTGTRTAARTPSPQVRPSIQRVLDSMSTTPACVRNRRPDILAVDRLGKALISPILATPRQPPNVARFMFLDPAATDYYPDWERMAAGTVVGGGEAPGTDTPSVTDVDIPGPQ